MNWRHAFAIAVLAFAAYYPTLRVGFIWDDHVIIEANPTLESWSWKNLAHDFTSDNALGRGDNYYRPMQAITDRIDYSLWGRHPAGYHLTNILFHIGAALLLYILILQLGFTPIAALLTSAIFTVHPIDSREFIIVTGRCTQMGFFFMLLTLCCALKTEWHYAGLAALSFVFGLLSKENVLLTPIFLVLLFLYRKDPWRRYWILAPLGGFGLLYLVMRLQSVHQTVGPLNPALLQLFMTKVYWRVCFHDAGLILWPWNLYSHRLIPHLTHLWPVYWAAFLALAVWLWRTNNRLGQLCLAWFVIWFLPTVPVMMRGGFMLDQWGYGVVWCLYLPMCLVLERALQSRSAKRRRYSGGIYLAYMIVLTLLVRLNIELQNTDEKMYRWALNFTTSNPIKYNLGLLLAQTGRPDEAAFYLDQYKAVYPEYDPYLDPTLKRVHEDIRRRQHSHNAGLPKRS